MLTPAFERFSNQSPISVMARGIVERTLEPNILDEWFDKTAKSQYTDTLLFSSIFQLMSDVVNGNRPSVNAAHKAMKGQIGVSVQSVYNKLNGIESHISEELVRYAAGELVPVVEMLGGTRKPLLPGYRSRLLDGNCIEATEHRIKELRGIGSGPLPGKTLVVYDWEHGLPVNVFACEDGHAQERSLLGGVLATVEKGELWIADRNFNVVSFTCGIDDRDAKCILRQHGNFPWSAAGPEKACGKTDTGKLFEQEIEVTDEAGKTRLFRRIRVELKVETRDGEKEICILTNLKREEASAKKIADIYRKRWRIETAFQELKECLNSEINALGYPPAAIFGFCVSLVSYMIMSVIKAALSSVHGIEKIENELSYYYVADEIRGTYRGMMIAIPEEEWSVFAEMSVKEFVDVLRGLSGAVNLAAFEKKPRGPKKPQPKRTSDPKKPHVSTARLLKERKSK